MVVAHTETKDVVFERLAAVVLNLVIGLNGRLRGEKIGPRAEHILSSCEAIRICSNCQLNARSWIEDTRTGHSVLDAVLKLGVAEADTVSECAGVEIDADQMPTCVVNVGERLK